MPNQQSRHDRTSHSIGMSPPHTPITHTAIHTPHTFITYPEERVREYRHYIVPSGEHREPDHPALSTRTSRPISKS